MRDVEVRALEAFRSQLGGEPNLIASAPGRVNLIGEHTDYNEGFVLPCAIDQRVALALRAGGGRLYSADFDEERALESAHDGTWSDYPRGVVWAFGERGQTLPAWDGAFAGDVPIGSGLSSSAAIEAATALALDSLNGLSISRTALAVLCQRAENGYIGVNSGIMDQYASLLCEAGTALLIDCRSLEAQRVPLRLRQASLSLFVCDTRIKRGLGKTAYNERRAACERAAATIGVKALRDATVGDLERLTGDELKRARHVVTEDERVLEAVDALERDNFVRLGALMLASHASLRDDYQVSIPELDTFVDSAMEAGAIGARLTGAGFGGCAIALVPQDRVPAVREEAGNAFRRHDFKEPGFYVFEPSSGAEVVQ